MHEPCKTLQVIFNRDFSFNLNYPYVHMFAGLPLQQHTLETLPLQFSNQLHQGSLVLPGEKTPLHKRYDKASKCLILTPYCNHARKYFWGTSTVFNIFSNKWNILFKTINLFCKFSFKVKIVKRGSPQPQWIEFWPQSSPTCSMFSNIKYAHRPQSLCIEIIMYIVWHYQYQFQFLAMQDF